MKAVLEIMASLIGLAVKMVICAIVALFAPVLVLGAYMVVQLSGFIPIYMVWIALGVWICAFLALVYSLET